ncbi:GNAT family N-acetyltransferase [Lapidilactobacillus wuchangensis]|uniref:GNAT family N-acetyltransferase n=1 Tax=Lapidilactobacillus wuchangensis TaxID=2486001 RepID=UPI001CDB7485|nr:GNAT family protein [Lapidilactobacillus wuchangensis]
MTKKFHPYWYFAPGNITMRLGYADEANAYYQHNFNPIDPEVVRMTGCAATFTENEVVDFFHNCCLADNRYDFLLINQQQQIIGESVINEIDWLNRCANYRIAIFQPQVREQGLGPWAIERTRDFAFEQLQLHRLELDVFSFNTRAQKAYQHAGFQLEGRRREAILDGDHYADDLLMALINPNDEVNNKQKH